MDDEPRELRPPRWFQITLFHASHPGHGVERVEVPYSDNLKYDVPGLRERWKPGAVFIILRCKCRDQLVVDIAGAS